MFRIDRALVNFANSDSVQANKEGELAAEYGGLDGYASGERYTEEQREKAEAEAAEIIKEAENEAGEIIRRAENEAEKIRERARKDGYTEGEAEAKAALDEKFREDEATLSRVLEEIYDEKTSMFEGMEEEVVSLSLEIAKKIINLASENDDTIFESMIKNALKQMNLEGKFTIRVGPGEYERFFSSGSAVFALRDGLTVTASVIKDTMLSEGGCIIDSDEETVDAGINSQLKRISLAFDKAGGV